MEEEDSALRTATKVGAYVGGTTAVSTAGTIGKEVADARNRTNIGVVRENIRASVGESFARRDPDTGRVIENRKVLDKINRKVLESNGITGDKADKLLKKGDKAVHKALKEKIKTKVKGRIRSELGSNFLKRFGARLVSPKGAIGKAAIPIGIVLGIWDAANAFEEASKPDSMEKVEKELEGKDPVEAQAIRDASAELIKEYENKMARIEEERWKWPWEKSYGFGRRTSSKRRDPNIGRR